MFKVKRWVLGTATGALVLGAIYGGVFAGRAGAQETRGRKYTPPPETSEIHVTVLRDSSGKPVRNAAVVMHPLKGNKDEGAMEVKTDEDGKVAIDIIPLGYVLRLQIIAPGFQTFGNDYNVDAPAKEITVRLKRPGEQYSIYKSTGTGGDQSSQAKAENKSSKSGNAQPPTQGGDSEQTAAPPQ